MMSVPACRFSRLVLLFSILILSACSDSNSGGSSNDDSANTAEVFTLSYSAGDGGTLTGTLSQEVAENESGSPVTAVPNTGYYFEQWSDGSTDNPRTDTNITADLTLSASFTINRYSLAYTAGSNGSLTGDTSQQVDHGSDGTAVTAVPDTDYNFVQWSDGSTDNPRTDTHVTGAITVSAQFALPPLTPWLDTAHSGALTVDVQGPTRAEITWPTSGGETYNLFISRDIETNLNSYGAYGAELMLDVTPPLMLDELVADEAVYIALEVNNELQAWSSFSARVWGLNRDVNAQAMGADGTRYMGGSFTQASLVTGSGVALPTGSDTPHALVFPEVEGTIYASAPDGHGGWYIGGSITRVGGEERSKLAHIDGQGRLTSWNPGAGNTVRALAVEGDTVYAGGFFTGAGGGTNNRSYLAAFDLEGNLLDWNPGANNRVYALALEGGTVYAGGQFTEAGGGTRQRLAAFDAEGNLLDWNPGANTTVYAVAVEGGTVYAGGGFSIAGGSERNRLAAFEADGVGNLQDWNPGASGGSVWALALAGGTVYAGGAFSDAGGGTGTTPRSRLAAFDADGNGELLDWNPGASGTVRALALDGGTVYAGGNFTEAGGSARSGLAAFDADGDGDLQDWNPGAGGEVWALAVEGNTLYMGGDFTGAGGGAGAITRNRLAAFDANGDLLEWNPGATSTVETLVMDGSTLYAGGSFSRAGGGFDEEPRNHLAAFDTDGDLLAWNPGANSTVNALAVAGDRVYAGGNFTGAGGGTGTTQRIHLAAFDADGDLLDWSPAAGGDVYVLAVDNGRVYVGGSFGSVAGGTDTSIQDRSNLAAFEADGDGELLEDWNPGTNSTVFTLVMQGGTLYAGGQFSEAGGETRQGLAAFDTDGDLLAWNPGANSTVETLVIDGSTVYAGGSFTSAGGSARSRLAAFGTNGNLLDWNPGASTAVRTLVVDGSIVYAGGFFTRAGGGTGTTLRSRLAAFDDAGELLGQ